MLEFEQGLSEHSDYERLSWLSSFYYKQSRAYVGIDESSVKLFSGLSARFAEQAFRLVPKEDAFIANILGTDVASAYYDAGWYAEVVRFSTEALDILGESASRGITNRINQLAAASIEKISAEHPQS